MDKSSLKLSRLSMEFEIKPFHCSDDDLNEFLLSDSKNYLKNLLAVTYLYESDTHTVAYFSILNDKISISDFETGNQYKKKIKQRMPKGKHFKSYPAMKIGRFAVGAEFGGNAIATDLMDYIKGWFINNNKTGCRFITVDAVKKSLGFYEKMGFDYLTTKDVQSDTRLMYFDLMTLF